MKRIMIILTALLTMTASANAMSYEQAREQALFLTDKMAYELNLTEDQYEAAYEVNLDYLMNINTADDLYGVYWRNRNLDLSYILLDWQYNAFCAANYFYRPLYWTAGVWHFGIYARYPRRNYFYFGRPHFYASYRGGHSWRMNGGRSWYHGRTFGSAHRNGGFGMRDGFHHGRRPDGNHHGYGNGGRYDGNRNGGHRDDGYRYDGNRNGGHGNGGYRPDGNRNVGRGNGGYRPDGNRNGHGNDGYRPDGNRNGHGNDGYRPDGNRNGGGHGNGGYRPDGNNRPSSGDIRFGGNRADRDFGRGVSTSRQSSTRTTAPRTESSNTARFGGSRSTIPNNRFSPSRGTSTGSMPSRGSVSRNSMPSRGGSAAGARGNGGGNQGGHFGGRR